MRASVEKVHSQRQAVATTVRSVVTAGATAEKATLKAGAAEAGLPGVGETIVAQDGLSATLVRVTDVSEIIQPEPRPDGKIFRPRPRRDTGVNGYFRILTLKFENNGSEVITIAVANIFMHPPDRTAMEDKIRVDASATDALIAWPDRPEDARPLLFAESLAVGRDVVVNVVFDLDDQKTKAADADPEKLLFHVEGLTFRLPKIDIAEEATDARLGTSQEAHVLRGRAHIDAEEQTAVSRTGLPTVGDSMLGDDGLEVTLVSVVNYKDLIQVHGSPFRPKNGSFKLVTIRFANSGDGNIVVNKDNIFLLGPDDTKTKVDSAGVNALIGMTTTAESGRPLFMVESVPKGKEISVAVVFDVPEELVDMNIHIEGFLFEVPNSD